MAAIRGYLLVTVGTAITFGSMLRAFMVLESSERVFVWSVVAVVGILIIAAGSREVLLARREEASADPEGAPTTADDRYGRK